MKKEFEMPTITKIDFELSSADMCNGSLLVADYTQFGSITESQVSEMTSK